MEAINNVLFDYQKSGSRYTTGIEDNPEKAGDTEFKFQFINNFYVTAKDAAPEIEAEDKWGVIKHLQVYVSGNVGPHWLKDPNNRWVGVFVDDKLIKKASASIRNQLSNELLFKPNIAVTILSANDSYVKVLNEAGCSISRDAVDIRIINDV